LVTVHFVIVTLLVPVVAWELLEALTARLAPATTGGR
jgi:hypothetical protein